MAEIKLPLYRAVIDESLDSELGVNCISIVGDPAIGRSFQALSDTKEPFKNGQVIGGRKAHFQAIEVALKGEMKYIVVGPVLIPGQVIYRRDNDTEYALMFDADTIKWIKQKFEKIGYGTLSNFDHMAGYPVKTKTQSILTEKDGFHCTYEGFEDLPEGTWFACVKVYDNEFYEKRIKTGQAIGFSVEAVLELVKIAENITMPKLTATEPSTIVTEQAQSNDQLLVFETQVAMGAFREVDFSISVEARCAARRALASISKSAVSETAWDMAQSVANSTKIPATHFAQFAKTLFELDGLAEQVVGGIDTQLWAASVAIECFHEGFIARNPNFFARNRNSLDKIFDDLSRQGAQRWIKQIRSFATKINNPNKVKEALKLIDRLQEALLADDVETLIETYRLVNKLLS